jgi:hypothetical protein
MALSLRALWPEIPGFLQSKGAAETFLQLGFKQESMLETKTRRKICPHCPVHKKPMLEDPALWKGAHPETVGTAAQFYLCAVKDCGMQWD